MKNFKTLNKILLALFILIISFGCSKSDDNSGGVQIIYHPAVEKPNIVVYSKYLPIDINEKKEHSLNATVTPLEQALSKLKYKSSDETVATVSDNGTITVHKEGMAVINISLEKDETNYSNVILNAYSGASSEEIPVVAVAVDSTYIQLKKGGEQAIFPSVRPGNATNKELIYISTNESVVSYKNGMIKGNNTGNGSIIIFSKANPKKYAFISVDVVEANGSSSGGSSSGGSSSFTPPAGVSPIDLNADPFSLIAKYQVLEYTIDGGEAVTATPDSNLRVNVNLDELGANIVKILMYIKIDGKEVRLSQKKDLSNYGSIPDIFTSLGAKITGKYTMEFTLDPVNYSELSKQGLINKGETLVVNIGKLEGLVPASGLGGDIVFDESSVPVESGVPETDVDEGNNSGETETPDSKPVVIEVESVILDIKEFSPIKAGEKVQVNAEVLPVDAADKSLTWTSSNPQVATVDSKGLVTILKNGSSVITAKASNGKKAEMKILPASTVDAFYLDDDKIELTVEVDKEAYITYNVYPEILNGQTQATYYSDNQEIATVDNTGKITAISTGETFIRVTLNGISKECYILVHPKPENVTPVADIELPNGNTGKYELSKGTFNLEAKVIPEDAFNKRLKYQSSNTLVADVNAAGEVTLKSTGVTDIIITSSSNPSIKKVYHLIVETLPTKVVYEMFDYGIALNETAVIEPIYEGNPTNRTTTYKILDNKNVASVDANTGKVTGLSVGTATLEATTENGKTATTVIHVYTPMNKENVKTLQGTYEIVDFNQANSSLKVGTNMYGGVERMIGEMTIEVQGNNVIIKSKIQMDSSGMNNFGGVMGQGKEEARKGQFQYTEYATATYNKNGFGTPGEKSGQVTFDNDKLKIYQKWSVFTVEVQVNTWIKKKSDTVKDLQPNKFHFYTNGINGDKKANAVAHHPTVQKPDKEPYYTYGLITKKN